MGYRVCGVLAGLAFNLGILPGALAFPATVEFHQLEGHLYVGWNLMATTHVPGHDFWIIDGWFVDAPARVFPVPSGTRAAGVFEPGRMNVLDAWVLVSVDPPGVEDGVWPGLSQHVHIEFSSRDTPVSSLPPLIPFAGGPVSDGTLQDMSPFLDLPTAGFSVLIESPGEAPEPSAALLMSVGVVGLTAWASYSRHTPSTDRQELLLTSTPGTPGGQT